MAHHEARPAARGAAPRTAARRPAAPSPSRHAPAGAGGGGGVIPAGYKRLRLPDGHPDRYLVMHAATERKVVAAGLPALEAWVAGVADGTIAADSAVPGYGLDGFALPAVEVEDPDTQEVPSAPVAPAAAPAEAPAPVKHPAPVRPPVAATTPDPSQLVSLTQRVEDLVKRQDQVLAELAELKATVGQLDATTTAAAQRLQTIHGNVADIQTTVHALAEAFLSAPAEAAPAGADGAGAG